MALPASGQITLNEIHIEAGGTTATEVTINDADVRALISASSGQANLSFADFYGASAAVTINITLTANTNNYNIFNSKGGTYVAGITTVNLTINSGVTIGSTSTGAYALETGTGWASGDVINIINNGTVKGRGGNGGTGGDAYADPVTPGNSTVTNATAGGVGGNAFRAQFATTFTNNGSVYGGGGGGGGGGSIVYGESKGTTFGSVSGNGGGGGAGVNGGTGGAAGVATGENPDQGNAGASGTATAGGAGGTGPSPQVSGNGGNGGGLGANGTAGQTLLEGFTNFAVGNGGSGGLAGFYQVGSSLINGGSGVGGTVGGRSS